MRSCPPPSRKSRESSPRRAGLPPRVGSSPAPSRRRGGLKIQTIHAFCERLLHLFPFEANVSARFQVLDDATAAELLAASQKHVLTQAALHPTGAVADALNLVGELAAESTVDTLMKEALKLKGWLREHANGPDGIALAMRRLATELGLAPGQTAADILGDIIGKGLPRSEWRSIAATLRTSKAKTEPGHAESLDAAAAATDDETRFESYVCIFLTQGGTPRADKSFLTKPFCADNPELAARMLAERERVEALANLRKSALAVERTHALLTLADAIIQENEARKSARGALDFDDLIARTARLLSRADAAWVLYKLDQGIDHILVDEAQDTSELQWSILKQIAEDFTAGEGRSDRIRTVFAVGDPKQSIFSFQGADPAAFEHARRHFKTRIDGLTAASDGRFVFHDEKLTLSFRSAQDVLGAVDKVFEVAANFRGLSFEEPGPNPAIVGTTHTSARQGAPGLVEIWEPETPVVDPDPDAWAKPLDEPDAGAPSVRLANRIATLIDRWRKSGDEAGRRIRPGDVLILVRNRGVFFEATISRPEGTRGPCRGRGPPCAHAAYRGARSGRARPGVAAAGRRPHARRRPEIAAGRP